MQYVCNVPAGNGVDESGIDKPPEPCIVLYKKRLDFTPPQNKTVGCGLLNIGNTCYINSTLQCLLYLPPWYNYVTKEHQQECKCLFGNCFFLVCPTSKTSPVRGPTILSFHLETTGISSLELYIRP